MALFRECLQLCELEDLGFSGMSFTYDNEQYGNNNIKVRLDRACADEQWRDLFPATKVVHTASSCSDHCLLVIQVVPLVDRYRTSNHRYEIRWKRDPALPHIIEQAWPKSNPQGNLGLVAASLKQIMMSLWSWSKQKFGHVNREIEKLCSELANLQEDNVDRQAIKEKMNTLDELLYREEMMWLQQS